MSPTRSKQITAALTQTAVYWGTPQSDGATGRTFADPIEISVRWEDRKELFRNEQGQELMSRAVVFVDRDVDRGGYLFLGSLSDLDSSEEADPLSISTTHEIREFTKTPDRAGTGYLRRVML